MSMQLAGSYIASAAQNIKGLQLLNSTKLASAAASISVSFPARTYLKIVFISRGKSANDTLRLRFNSDSDQNYSYTYDWGTGNADTTAVSQTSILLDGTSGTVSGMAVVEMMNILGVDKFGVRTKSSMITNAGSAPNREISGVFWNNETSQITSVTVFAAGGANLSAESQILVFGANANE